MGHSARPVFFAERTGYATDFRADDLPQDLSHNTPLGQWNRAILSVAEFVSRVDAELLPQRR